ncbi:Phosphatidyl-myo-inositol mannosyltransferase [subsurface metagenome]
MNICFIVPCDLATDNGGKTHTVELAENWQGFGHKVVIFPKGWRREGELRDLRYIKVPYIPVKGFYEVSFSLSSLVLIVIYHLRFKFNVIYERKMLISLSVLAGKLLKIPVIVELNDIPYSIDIDRVLQEENRVWKRTLLKVAQSILHLDVWLTSKLSTKIITTAQLKLPHIEKRKISSIPFGANITLFKPLNKMECRKNLNYPEEGRIICFVGSFLPWQGIEYIVEAMPKILDEFPNTLLILIGDHEPRMQASRELKEKIMNMVKTLDLSKNLIFVGRVPYEEVPAYINASDVCIVTQSKSRSGFSPLKLFEYMACGKPVVASDIEGVREIVKESGGGLLVEAENSAELAQAILRLLKDEGLMKQMGENGLRCVTEKYSWENTARKALEVMQESY